MIESLLETAVHETLTIKNQQPYRQFVSKSKIG